ncbi:MAG TPA: HAMP domain-containing sensor histidine kinase [Vicinamibacterales bacterium]|nr:HAMP domain-containing sensor histidine kinase [Vicinamibacterales bacterium]
MWLEPGRPGTRGVLLFAAGLAVATGLTFWLGLRATREWQHSTREAAETRANEVAALLTVALERDMKGGQVSVLVPFNEAIVNGPPYELADRFARGFARFPYLESFFVWTERGGPDGVTYVFNRADRRPRWDAAPPPEDPFPVVFRRDPVALRDIVSGARAEAAEGLRFGLEEVDLGGVRYQAVSQRLYEGEASQTRLSAIIGFLVDLDWAQRHYFSDFIRQIQSIIGDPTLSIEIRNADAQPVAVVGPPSSGALQHARAFNFVFADQAVLAQLPRRERPQPWSARVGVGNEASLAAASQGATRTLVLLGLGGLATIIGLAFTVRAARVAADLAVVQAEFVSAVSHEMKTPLSLIKLASDTLANGRFSAPDAVGEYGRMINVEAQHLTRLIDNVLCYARINDLASPYDLEPVDLTEVVQESIDRFQAQISERRIEVQLQVPSDPVTVNADHLMLRHVFDNVIENAITHAGRGRWLGITVTAAPSFTTVEVTDHGDGIAPGDLPRVFEKFYRPKGTRQRGTGLGLAIVRRIIEDHRGRVTMTSLVGRGTTVLVSLPTGEPQA